MILNPEVETKYTPHIGYPEPVSHPCITQKQNSLCVCVHRAHMSHMHQWPNGSNLKNIQK